MTALAPVSAALEADLRTWVRRQGVVLWLDLDAHYTGLVEQLRTLRERDNLPYEVITYRGSHLELLLELEDLTGGADKPRLVVHLPGFNEERVRQTPLLELYAAGARYRKSLPTLVGEAAAGHVSPDEAAAFQQQPGLTLEQADTWLQTVIGGADSGELGETLRRTSLAALADDLVDGGPIARRLAETAVQQALWQRIEAASGMPLVWRHRCIPPGTSWTENFAFALGSWALAVEYVDDLQRPPVAELLDGIADLPRKTTDACLELVGHLRGRHPSFYARTADETEDMLADEVKIARAEDLGKIDTFRFEDEKVLQASLAALGEERYDEAEQWAQLRIEGSSFWLHETPSRRSTWELVRAAASLGRTIEAAGQRLQPTSLADAVALYQRRGATVDQHHRRLEQQRAALLYPQLPEFEQLKARLDGLRARWRTWADAWACDFNALCRNEGFLPPAALQQRELFDEVVRPAVQEPGTTAFFVIDALRYEMALELHEALVGLPATTAHLDARLAELPTITAVGMNVLAPVVDGGRLHPAVTGNAFKGFACGEFRVSSRETRQRAMQVRVGGETCPLLDLGDLLDRSATSLKQAIARARLVVVHSTEIDDAGEKNVGPSVFQQLLQRVRAGWRMLRDAGVRRFVITSDHGFLLLDPSAGERKAHGRKIDPRRRYVLSPAAADHQGEVRVALADLRYDGVEGHLMFPDGTAVFDTGNRKMGFVHGGNSLQERVIPVLTVAHRAAAGGSPVTYQVEAEARDGVAGMHCLAATVKVASAQTTLDFGAAKDLELVVRAVDVEGIQVELCQTRGPARLSQGAIVAAVGQSFELFFRLLGRTDARAQVELAHTGAEAQVLAGLVEQRFAVAPNGRGPSEDPAPSAGGTRQGWLEQLPEGGIRELFAHLAAHGAVTEPEAASMLGGPRAVRRFALHFEKHAACAPFAVRIETVGGIKRYVRDGSDT